jgi:hypothetical protein
MPRTKGFRLLSPSTTETLIEGTPETPFYIAGTGSSTRPRRTLKQGDCFADFDSHADIGATPGGPDGIFYCDTLYLSHLKILLNDSQPLLLGSAEAAPLGDLGGDETTSLLKTTPSDRHPLYMH